MVAQQLQANFSSSDSYKENVENSLLTLIKDKRITKRRRSSSSPLSLTMSISTTVNSGDSFSSSVSGVSEEEDMAHCLILLAQGNTSQLNNSHTASSYDCKTCNRSFQSFQALGGHRASHKKQKLPVYLTSNQNDSLHDDRDVSLTLEMATSAKVKLHECSICKAEFSSGQALGGHMRRHRPIGISSSLSAASSKVVVGVARGGFLSLDLNLLASEESFNNKFIFSSNEKTLVFSPASSHLVDCYY